MKHLKRTILTIVIAIAVAIVIVLDGDPVSGYQAGGDHRSAGNVTQLELLDGRLTGNAPGHDVGSHQVEGRLIAAYPVTGGGQAIVTLRTTPTAQWLSIAYYSDDSQAFSGVDIRLPTTTPPDVVLSHTEGKNLHLALGWSDEEMTHTFRWGLPGGIEFEAFLPVVCAGASGR